MTTQTLEAASQTADPITGGDKPTFKIFSGALKAFEKEIDGTTRKYLGCTASSTIEDLHGDRMTEDCVRGMAPQAKNKGMTIFLNHSYKVPEDVFGKTMDAKIVQRSHDGDGKAIWDLDLEIMLNESNERAVNTYAAIKDQGMKLGVSIGALIEDYEFVDEDEGFWGGLIINAVNLLEASIVGIPANQRSWVINGIEALGAPKQVIRKAAGLPDRKDLKAKTVEASAGVLQEVSSRYMLDGVDVTNKLDVVSTSSPAKPNADGSITIPGTGFKSVTTIDKDVSGDPEEELEETTSDEPTTTEVEASTSPDQETQEDDDASTDTDAKAAEGSPSAEAAADAVATLKSAGADNAMLEILLGFLEGATEEVASLRTANKTLTEERDQARQDVQRAAEAVELLAKTPIGRKAHFAAPVDNFRARFAGYYDEGFLKLLEGDQDDNE